MIKELLTNLPQIKPSHLESLYDLLVHKAMNVFKFILSLLR